MMQGHFTSSSLQEGKGRHCKISCLNQRSHLKGASLGSGKRRGRFGLTLVDLCSNAKEASSRGSSAGQWSNILSKLGSDFTVPNTSNRSCWGGERRYCPPHPTGHNLLTSLKKPLHHRLAQDEPSYDSGALLLHTPRFQQHLKKEKNCPPTACQGSGLSSLLQSWNPLCPEAHWGVKRLTALKSDWLP